MNIIESCWYGKKNVVGAYDRIVVEAGAIQVRKDNGTLMEVKCENLNEDGKKRFNEMLQE